MHEIGSRIDESRHLLATEHGGQLDGILGKGRSSKVRSRRLSALR